MLSNSKNPNLLSPLPTVAVATRPPTVTLIINFIIFLPILFVNPTSAGKPHVINFRSPNLFPESFKWDSKAQHFIVGSLPRPAVLSVSDAGIIDTLISDSTLPPNSFFLGLTLDRGRNRLLAVVHRKATSSSPVFNALAAYDLTSRRRLFLTPLNSADDTTAAAGDSSSDVANDVAVDFSGNSYVTNSGADIIWKVDAEGGASILSRSKVFKSHPVDLTAWYHYCGLNGVVYISKGYLLVVQTNTGKLYKVNVDDGSARTVILNKELTAADGIAVRSDGVVVVVSQEKLYYLKSEDSWGEGVVFDETALEAERQASAVTVGEERRVYVLYRHVNEGMMGNVERDEFSIVEIESEKENKEENVWLFVLIGLGLAYFLFWRFQMGQLVQNINKKTA